MKDSNTWKSQLIRRRRATKPLAIVRIKKTTSPIQCILKIAAKAIISKTIYFRQICKQCDIEFWLKFLIKISYCKKWEISRSDIEGKWQCKSRSLRGLRFYIRSCLRKKG
jgi:hypothetical protein